MARSADLVFNLIGKDKTGPAFKAAAGNADKTRGAFDKVGVSMSSLAKLAGGLALGAGLVAGAKAAVSFGAEAAMLASDLGEVQAANEQIFGADAARQLNAWSAKASTALGQTKTQALDAAKTFGIFGKAAGLSGTDLSGFSMELTTLATDMASFNNTSPEEAIEAIGAALRGEAEPMRRFGVLLDDATLKARAMEMGIWDGTGSLTQQQKVLAAHQEILAQTSDQQGDFARTSGGMANQLRTLSAVWMDVKTAAGEALVPVAEKILPEVTAGLTGLLTAVQENMPEIQGRLTEFADGVIAKWPEVRESIGDTFEAFRAEWPEIRESLESFASALERVGGMAEAMWGAFKALPPEVQQILSMLALAKATGVLDIAFKATDLVKSFVATHVTLMAGSVSGLPGGAAGGAAGTAGKAGATGAAGGASSKAGTAGRVARYAPYALALAGGPQVATAVGVGVTSAAGAWVADKWMDQVERSTSAANVYASALNGVSGSARVAMTEQDKLAATAAVATGAFSAAGGASLRLAAEVNKAGTAAGLSEAKVDAMTAAAYAIPAGASATQLTDELRKAGVAAELSDAQIDDLTSAALGVPAAANLPNLQAAIANAGRAAGFSDEKVRILSASVFAIPRGATAERAGAAIYEAGIKAGIADGEVREFIAGLGLIPPNKTATITTNAPAEADKVNALQAAINRLEGRQISVGVKLSGSTGGGGSGGGPAGGASTVAPWLNGEVDSFAEALVPKLAAAGNIGSGPWVRPTSNYVVSSEWMRGGTAIHYGIDLAAPMGTPVHSVAAGVVTRAFWNNGYGNFVEVDHGGVYTSYSHLSSILARAGQQVGPGTVIGAIGSTGDSTGPHLHFETRPGGRAVEPRGFMASRGVGLRSGGVVPVNVSNGEWFVPAAKAAKHMPLLHAINSGQISGPGSGTSDSIRGVAQSGSFVVNAAATRRHKSLLRSITHGSGPSQYLRDGGVVGGGPVMFGPGGPQTVELHISGRVLYGALSDYRRESGRAVLEFA